MLLGEELGILIYGVFFLVLNVIGKNIFYGVNYVLGGGGILNVIGRIFVSLLFLKIILFLEKKKFYFYI